MSQEALVRVSYGSQGIVELQDGSQINCKYRRSVGRPYCGDRVMIESADGHATLYDRHVCHGEMCS